LQSLGSASPVGSRARGPALMAASQGPLRTRQTVGLEKLPVHDADCRSELSSHLAMVTFTHYLFALLNYLAHLIAAGIAIASYRFLPSSRRKIPFDPAFLAKSQPLTPAAAAAIRHSPLASLPVPALAPFKLRVEHATRAASHSTHGAHVPGESTHSETRARRVRTTMRCVAVTVTARCDCSGAHRPE